MIANIKKIIFGVWLGLSKGILRQIALLLREFFFLTLIS
jgi:hypothetical protein